MTARGDNAAGSVGVVVIARDVAPWIGRALRSVAEQRLAPARVVVVENGSGDDTRERIRAAAARLQGGGAALTLIERSDPLGAGRARNLGARAMPEVSTLAFLDGDDWWRPGFLAGATRALERHPASPAAFSWLLVRNSEGALRSARLRLKRHFDYGDLCRNKTPLLTASSLVVSREAFEAVGGFCETLVSGQDVELVLRLTRDGRRLVCCPRFLVCYRRRPGSLSGDPWTALGGQLELERRHPAYRNARNWWWLVAAARRGGDAELRAAVARQRPRARLADYLTGAFALHLLRER